MRPASHSAHEAPIGNPSVPTGGGWRACCAGRTGWPAPVGHGVHVAVGQHRPGLVGVVGGAAAEQVGREGHEALLGEAVAHALEERRQPPPRVQHQDPRPVAGVGHGDVAGAGGSGSHGDDRTEADRRSTTRRYAWPSWLPETESTAAPSAGPSASPPGITRTTCAGSPTARSARRPWWCGAGTAPTSPTSTAPHGRRLAEVADRVFDGHYVDDHMRNIPDHWHAHARPVGGFFGTGSGGTACPPASSGAGRDRRGGAHRG